MAQRSMRRAQIWSRLREKGSLIDQGLLALEAFCRAAWVRRLLYALPVFCFGAILAQGRVLSGLCPFAPAFVCAMQMKDKHTISAGLGGAFGALLSGDPSGVLFCLLLTILLEGLRFAGVRPNALLCLLLAGIFQITLPLLYAQTAYDWILSVLSAFAVLLLAPLYAGFLTVRLRERKHLCPEELFGGMLLLVSGLSGLRGWQVFGASPVMAVLLFCCITAGFCAGAGAGALCGVACGLLPAFTQPLDFSMLGVLPLLGLLCGLPLTSNRLRVLPAAFVALLLAVSWDNSLLTLPHGLEAAIAITGFFLLSGHQRERIRALFCQENAVKAPDEEREAIVKKLQDYAGLYRRMAQAGGEAGGQYTAVGQALDTMAQELQTPPISQPQLALRVMEVMEQAGFAPESVTVETHRGRIQAQVRLLCPRRDGLCSRELRSLVSRVVEKPLRCVPAGLCPEKGSCLLLLAEEPPLCCAIGTANAPLQGVSGDTFSTVELPGDRLLLALTDGMGHGGLAEKESKAAMELLETYLLAGFAAEAALTAVNDLLLRRCTGESFSTVDMLLLDRHTGVAEVLKIGAAPSYIRRGRQLISLSGEGLPLGILPKVKPAVTHLRLEDGDTLFLLTDGLCDALAGDESALERMISELPVRDPDKATSLLLEQVKAQGNQQDDMTCAVIRIGRCS